MRRKPISQNFKRVKSKVRVEFGQIFGSRQRYLSLSSILAYLHVSPYIFCYFYVITSSSPTFDIYIYI